MKRRATFALVFALALFALVLAWVQRHPSAPMPLAGPSGSAAVAGRAGAAYSRAGLTEARPGELDGRLTYSTAWSQDFGEPSLDQFRNWTERYLTTRDANLRRSLVPEGVQLATSRRGTMAALIQRNPADALASAVPAVLYGQLPAQVVALLEERVGGLGELAVRHVDWKEGDGLRGEVVRTATIGGTRYRANVSGRRLGQLSTARAYLHGIAIGGELALAESPVRLLEPGEDVSAAIALPTTTTPASANEVPVAAAIGGTVVQFAQRAALIAAEERLQQLEALMRPGAEQSLAALLDPQATLEPVGAATSRSLGAKRALVVRVDFPDLPGEPQNFGGQACTDAYLQSVNTGEIAPFYAECSFGRTSLTFEIAPKLYRAAQATTVYSQNPQSSGGDALGRDVQALVAADYDLATYDHVIMVFSGLPGYPAGMAGGRDIWISGFYRFSVVAHELGHNYGWGHANLWVGNSSPIDSAGWSWEYGDPFDVMGSGNFPESFGFGVATMYTWGWLTAQQTATATADGTYRLYASDQKGLSPSGDRLLGVKVRRDDSLDYWVAFRSPTAGGWGAYPAGVHVARFGRGTLQTEALPLNNLKGEVYNNIMRDGIILPVGASFTDPTAGLSVQVIARGGTGRDQYVDVAVLFNPTAILPDVGLQPVDQLNVRSGASAVFSTWARAGQPQATYRWQRQRGGVGAWSDLAETTVFSGTATGTLVVNATDLTMHQDRFRCVLQNSAGSDTSDSAQLTVVEVTSGSYTLAGRTGQTGLVDGPGALAQFAFPMALALAADGSLYVSDARNNRVRLVAPNGTVSTLPMEVYGPRSLCLDATGNLFVADSTASVIRRLSPAGVASIYAGQLWSPGSTDGARATARFKKPTGLAIDTAGNLYVSDVADHTVRKISTDGTVSTLAGTAGESGYGDGTGGAARFHFLDGYNSGLAVGPDGAIYVADAGNHCVRRIGAQNQVTTLAGSPDRVGSADGLPPIASLDCPVGVLVDATGTVYLVDAYASTLRAVTPAGVLLTIGGSWGSAEGVGAAMGLKTPQSLALGAGGRLYIADANNGAIRVYLPTAPAITRQPAEAVDAPVGGRALFSVEAIGALPLPSFRWQQRPSSPSGSSWNDLAEGGVFNGAGSSQLFVNGIPADLTGCEYRCVLTNASGEAVSRTAALSVATTGVFVFAGTPGKNEQRASVVNDAGVSSPLEFVFRPAGSLLFLEGLGPRLLSTAGSLSQPLMTMTVNASGLAADDAGNIYFTDMSLNAVKKLLPDGRTELIAGADQYSGGGSVDGVGAAARLRSPTHLVRARDGTLFVSDQFWSTVRAISPTGQVRTVAGQAGSYAFLDGTGAAARFGHVDAMALNADGNLLVRDSGRLLRQVTPDGVVTTLAGSLQLVGSIDGQGTAASFPQDDGGLAVGPDGTVYVAERSTNRIRTVSPSGDVGTLRGSDGAPLFFDSPGGIAVDGSGTLYVGETGRHTISGYVRPPQLVQGPRSVAALSGAALTLTVDVSGSPAPLLQWFKNGEMLAGETGAELVIASLGASSVGEYTVRISNRGSYRFSAPAIVQLAVAPRIVQQPVNRRVQHGSAVTFAVGIETQAEPSAAMNFQWYKDGVALTDGGGLTGATSATLSFAGVVSANAGIYKLVASNVAGQATSNEVGLVVVAAQATHSVAGGGYRAGGTVTIANTITYVGTLSGLDWSVLVPDGWSYATSGGSAGESQPKPADTGLLEWTWTTVPASPVTFTYTMNVPADASGILPIAAQLVTRASGPEVQILVEPDPLSINPLLYHSADTDSDFKLNLTELLRVIELYNTRNGTTRTGRYLVEVGTEDGFAADLLTANNAAVTLAAYHTADTTRDGKLNLTELLRVIELYNYRSGTTRTGQYHRLRTEEAPTEDGFAPAP